MSPGIPLCGQEPAAVARGRALDQLVGHELVCEELRLCAGNTSRLLGGLRGQVGLFGWLSESEIASEGSGRRLCELGGLGLNLFVRVAHDSVVPLESRRSERDQRSR